jgi:hypothetical protein
LVPSVATVPAVSGKVSGPLSGTVETVQTVETDPLYAIHFSINNSGKTT